MNNRLPNYSGLPRRTHFRLDLRDSSNDQLTKRRQAAALQSPESDVTFAFASCHLLVSSVGFEDPIFEDPIFEDPIDA